MVSPFSWLNISTWWFCRGRRILITSQILHVLLTIRRLKGNIIALMRKMYQYTQKKTQANFFEKSASKIMIYIPFLSALSLPSLFQGKFVLWKVQEEPYLNGKEIVGSYQTFQRSPHLQWFPYLYYIPFHYSKKVFPPCKSKTNQ